MKSKALLLLLSCLSAASVSAAPSAGPREPSRVLHVDCGARAEPGKTLPWSAPLDNAALSEGYRYSAQASVFNWGGKATCWYSSAQLKIEITCPRGAQGDLYLYCFDCGGVSRRQTVSVSDEYEDYLESFGPKEGRWLQYRLTPELTQDGRITVEILNHSVGAAVSRLDFFPSGPPVVLPAEGAPVPAKPTLDELVRQDWARQDLVRVRQLLSGGWVGFVSGPFQTRGFRGERQGLLPLPKTVPPKLDGSLDDPCWTFATKTFSPLRGPTLGAPNDSYAMFCTDGETLFVALSVPREVEDQCRKTRDRIICSTGNASARFTRSGLVRVSVQGNRSASIAGAVSRKDGRTYIELGLPVNQPGPRQTVEMAQFTPTIFSIGADDPHIGEAAASSFSFVTCDFGLRWSPPRPVGLGKNLFEFEIASPAPLKTPTEITAELEFFPRARPLMATLWRKKVSPGQKVSGEFTVSAEGAGAILLSGKASNASAVEEDARGGCDGKKTGNYGFHTGSEPRPWWQVDLGKPFPLSRVIVYNRCDDIPWQARMYNIVLLLSDDEKTWRTAYENKGKPFGGVPQNDPLVVPLQGRQARYVRIENPTGGYLHLDEIEVYGLADPNLNLALKKPARQSSVSEWSAGGGRTFLDGFAWYVEPVSDTLARARRLRDDLGKPAPQIEVLGKRSKELTAASFDARAWRDLYLKARRLVRDLAFQNPLLDFDTLLFVKSAPGSFPHMSDQFYGWFSRPGGGVYLLEGLKSRSPQARCLTSDMPEGSFYPRPDLSYDGKKLLFCYCRYHADVRGMLKVDKEKLPEDCFYHIFEMNADGGGRRQLTHGRYDDLDPKYLPNGEIVFLSTRKGQFVQCGRPSAEATRRATLPDSYVRCGGNGARPVAVYTLHVMDPDGANLRAISAFENFEWTPFVGGDGRILYARWDYIDRPNASFISLWATNPDGTNPQLVYGNFTARPQCVFEAQPIPGSHKLVFTASSHHSITGGSLVLLDRNLGTEEARPITRLTPEVCFPETEGWPVSYYANPFPLSEKYFLAAWGDRKLPAHTIATDEKNPTNALGLYLCDAFGNLELIYRDPDLTCMYPIPLRPRPRPPVLPSVVAWDAPQAGCVLLQDVYQGLSGIPRGSVKSLRIVAVVPKLQPEMNKPSLGVSSEDPGKFMIGTAPVEPDGSAYFRVPSGVPLFFQALDGKGLAVQTMRTLTYVQPEQTLSCVGCHESRESAPLSDKQPLALQRAPSRLTPGPPGAWPLRYDQLVQPVLDRRCVSCHRPGSQDKKAAQLDLTAPNSYDALMGFGGDNLRRLAFERPRSVPGECAAAKSKLLALLTQEKGHEGVKLDADDLNRLITWMDLYAQKSGCFSEAQEKDLLRLRETWANLLVAGRP